MDLSTYIGYFSKKVRTSTIDSLGFWPETLGITLLSGLIYILFEYLFFVTGPSLNNVAINLLEIIQVFLFNGLIIAAAGSAAVFILYILDRLLPFRPIRSIFRFLRLAPATIILASLALLIVDNFTYTIFKFGILTSTGFGRGIYAFIFISILVVVYLGIKRFHWLTFTGTDHRRLWLIKFPVAILTLSLVSTSITSIGALRIQPEAVFTSAPRSTLPNIIIFGSDGVNADRLSLYGYDRKTTPTLDALAAYSIVGLNAFQNANTSAGSLTSMLTGKLPSTTRVLYPPDILEGIETTQHLPAILKQLGYLSFEYSVPYYADAISQNFQKGFDRVNGRSLHDDSKFNVIMRLGGDYPYYFLNFWFDRISSRLLHIFFITPIQNSYRAVTTGKGSALTDRQKVDQLIQLVKTSQTPIFAHVHLLGTHGPYYYPAEFHFSNPLSAPDSMDAYDDAIRDADNQLKELIEALKTAGKYDNTILVVYSDHGNLSTLGKVPFLIHFPNDDYAGETPQNVQNLDIAPTILDYMNIPIPSWMEGDSLLESSISANRRLNMYSVNYITANGTGDLSIDPDKISPHFAQFGTYRMVICNRWYEVNLRTNRWHNGIIKYYLGQCDPSTIPPVEKVKREMISHLASKGFDVSPLKE